MNTQIVKHGDISIAVINSDTCLIDSVSSALDFVMSVKYETGCTNIALNKEAITGDFFILSTCLAGEILQKFINYGIRFAVYGDFSAYTSKPLRDFIYESNKGNDVFFQPDAVSAAAKLCGQ